MDEVYKLFYNTQHGFKSFNALYEVVKEKGIKVPKKELKEWYDAQAVNQLTKTPKVHYNKIQSPYNAVGVLQMDLMDISRLSRENKNYKFIMNVIDVYSRYVWSFPLKNKEAGSVAVALKKVLEEIKKKFPDNTLTLTTDQGKEYEGAVNKLCKEYEVARYFNDPNAVTAHTITAVVERYHRTLLNKMRKFMTFNDSLSFIDELDSFTKNYNETIHSTLKAKPEDVYQGKVVIPKVEKEEIAPLEIGQLVRTISWYLYQEELDEQVERGRVYGGREGWQRLPIEE